MASHIRSGGLCLLTFFLLSFWACPVLLWSQEGALNAGPALKAELDTDSAPVGSMVWLTLHYRLPEGAHLAEAPEISGLEDLTVINKQIGPKGIRIRLLVDQLGSWTTGPLSLAYLDKDQNPQVLTTGPVSLTVLSNLGDSPNKAQLRPIQGIVPTAALWWTYLPWAAGLLGGLLLAGGLFWWYRRRRGIKGVTAVLEPPHIRARKDMEALEGMGLFEKGDIKGFYFRFSEILRRYLEALRGFPAAEYTTQEIARCLNTEQDQKLLQLLRHADMVKFADVQPTQAKKEEEMKAAFSYILETSPPKEAEKGIRGPHGGTP